MKSRFQQMMIIFLLLAGFPSGLFAEDEYQFQNIDCSDGAIPMCCLTLIRPGGKRKTFPVQYTGCAAISPSKKQVAYREWNTLMVYDAERDGVVYTLPLLSYEQGAHSVFSWSSDSRKIAFAVVEEGCSKKSLMGIGRLLIVDIPSREKIKISSLNVFEGCYSAVGVADPVWSPDGRWIVVWETRPHRLIVFGADGKKEETLVLSDDAWLEDYGFSEDSKKLYYIPAGTKQKKYISLKLSKQLPK